MGLGSCSANSEQTGGERFIDADHSSAKEGRAGDTVRPRRSKVVGWGDPKELECWLQLTDGLGLTYALRSQRNVLSLNAG